MKKILTLAASLAFVAGISAQSYDKLWEQVQRDAEKDLPQSALNGVEQIRLKATTENNATQLLRALLMLRIYGGQVSPDSAQVYVNDIEQMLAQEQQPVMKALQHAALAQCYAYMEANDRITERDYRERSKQHFAASLHDLSALAQVKVNQYLPLFTYHKDSKYFNNDLLHVLLDASIESACLKHSEKSELLTRVMNFYKEHGAVDAALLLRLQLYERNESQAEVKGRIEASTNFATLSSLSREYATSPMVIKVYEQIVALYDNYEREQSHAAHNDSVLYAWAQKGIEQCSKGSQANVLRNFVARVTTPSARMEHLSTTYYPHQQVSCQLSARNLTQVELRMVRLFNSQRELRSHEGSRLQSLAARQHHAEWQMSHTFAPAAAYAWQSDSLQFTLPNEPGIYYVELKANGKHLDGATLNVTSLAALKLATANGKNRVTVVNSQTGTPVAGAQITAYQYNRWDSKNPKLQQLKVYVADEKGEVNIMSNSNAYDVLYGLSSGKDQAAELFSLNHLRYYNNTNSSKAATKVQLYTDRAIYRPGQKVQFTGVVFTHQGDDYKTESDYKINLQLRNANRKVIDSLLVSTDEWGTFSGSFVLPAQCLTGNFTLQTTQCSSSATHTFKVEEYKRPTFTTETKPVSEAYSLGDTVRVEGVAQTYSGVPIACARVQYTVQRSAWYFWDDDEFTPQSGETITQADGHFTLPMWLAPPAEGVAPSRYNRYTYTLHYTITADNGETVQGSAALAAATHAAWLTADVPTTLCREQGKPLPMFTIQQLNASGQTMPAHGTYTLRKGDTDYAQGTFEAGHPFKVDALATLPSGKYVLRYSTEAAAADSAEVLVFSYTDKQPADVQSPLFFYNEKNEQAGSVKVVYGSPCKQATLFVDVVAGNRIVDSQRITCSNELRHFDFNYKELYGDGARLLIAMMHEGHLYTAETEVVKPTPNKQLLLQWNTFRSRLTPGQNEEWVLQVSHPDGTPAQAQLAACLYDASLDALAKSRWADYAVTFSRFLPQVLWSSNASAYNTSLWGSLSPKMLATRTLHFSSWRSELFDDYANKDYALNMIEAAGPRPMRALANVGVSHEAKNALADRQEVRLYKQTSVNPQVAMGESMSATPRSNFAETAFFRPALRTNQQGQVSIAFTLPESMTQWNFCALAHDRQMNYGRIDTTVVARKEFMVEPALPRFLRKGDKADLPVKVTNLSNHVIKATLQLTLSSVTDKAPVFKATQPIQLAAGESQVYTIAYDAAQAEGLLVCRTTAQGSGFSDGEEHYLPILTTDVKVTRTLPFSFTQKGVYNLSTDTLFNVRGATHRALTIELSSNPTWYAVTALPALSATQGNLNAIEWATNYYVWTIAQHIVQCHPEVEQLVKRNAHEVEQLTALKTEGLTDATPWLQQAESEQQRAAALRHMFDADAAAATLFTAVDKLKALQQPDGSFSWFPGMSGNAWVTTDVALLIARSERLTHSQQARVHPLLVDAFHYLQKQVSEQVTEMKRTEHQLKTTLVPSELQLRYLYLRTIMQQKPDADARYLLQRAATMRHQLTMYGKALTAIVLSEAGYNDEAKLSMKSLLEHTVTHPNMGRYFDTPRAEWSWRSYRIPTQCAAIEALHYFGNDAAANELRLWLLQAKRTQMWETSRATTDAVYALLMSNDSTTILPTTQHEPLYYTLYNNKRIVGFNAPRETEVAATVGYIKQAYTDESALGATRLKVDKRTDGLSWGCAYATFMAPASEVKTEGKGLLLTHSFEVKQGNEWVPLNDVAQCKKGDHVRQVFTLTADRDYDFVSLTAARSANLVPQHPLSGYDAQIDLPAYRAVRDAQTDYFIEKLSKGTHRFVEEYFVDRTGHYTQGISHVVCVYAPEFQAWSQQ